MKHHHGPKCGCTNEKGEILYLTAPNPATQKALDYAETNFEHSIESLNAMIKIPSISSNPESRPDMQNSATATAQLLHDFCLDNVEILNSDGPHPYVYADWCHKPGAPTLLLYAHHDVQPEGRHERWKSPPFTPTVSQGRLYGRGAADDKAGIMAHVAAISAYLKTQGELPVNIKILFEGEEEIGSPNLASFAKTHAQKLQADGMILTDCANIESGIPSITTALRGLVTVDIEICTLQQPIHSGLWGGIIPDCNIALSKILASLVDESGLILIPGFYDDVLEPSADSASAQNFSRLILNSARAATGMLPSTQFMVPENTLSEHLWNKPSLSINALQSGTRAKASNVIQDGAWARIGVRIVPNMKPQKVLKQLSNYIKSVCPKGFEVKVTEHSAGDWWRIENPNDPVYQIAARSLEKGYNHSATFIGCGASIPFVTPLVQALGGIPAILVGIEDPYTLAHSENESLNLSDFKKAIFGQIHMLRDLSEWQRT